MKPENGDSERSEDIRSVFEEVAKRAEAAQGEALGQAEKLGYLAQTARIIGETYSGTILSDISAADQDYLRQNARGVGSYLSDAVISVEPYIREASGGINEALQVFAIGSTTADTTCHIYLEGPAQSAIEPCPFLPQSDESAYEEKLRLLDESLADVYRSAWHNKYADSFDPGRGALWQMRQVYDHFFGLLAPDERVIQSAWWTTKEGDNPNAVHREERIRFAAEQWVANETQRRALQDSSNTMIETYSKLNQAHKRGGVDPAKAARAFRNMDAILRQWIDSILDWPPVFAG